MKKTVLKLSKILLNFLRGNLENKGERVELLFSKNIDFENLNMYQKSHYKRYEFAVKHIKPSGISGDFACGTGYGSAMLSELSNLVIGADIDKKVIDTIKKRYAKFKNISFLNLNLLELEFNNYFDSLVSFETIEHLYESDIPKLFQNYSKALKSQGIFIFSTPFLQERSEQALKMGFHLTFDIDETKINKWLSDAGFGTPQYYYQSYETHIVENIRDNKDFIICVAHKL